MRVALIEPVVSSVDDVTSTLKYRQSGENTGNLVHGYALRKIMSHPNNEIYSFPWRFSPPEVREKADLLVIACANQVGSHADMGPHAALIRDCGLPVLAIGLGAQSKAEYLEITDIPRGTTDWLKTIADLSPSAYTNIYTRGEFSATIISKLIAGDVWTGCCPSLFIANEPQLGQIIGRRAASESPRLAIAAGHTEWPEIEALERKYVDLVTDQRLGGSFIVQSDSRLVLACTDGSRELSDIELEETSNYLFGLQSKADVHTWFSRYGRVFFDFAQWSDHIKSFDLVLGSRFHGVAVAYQAGIPGILIVHDERVRELAVTSGYLSAEVDDATHNFSRGWIQRKIQEFNAMAFDANRQLMARNLCAFFNAHETQCADYLYTIAGLRNFE